MNLMLMAKLLGNQVRVLSANCQGLRDKAKRQDVISYFKDLKPSILCLQDTHLTIKEENNLRMFLILNASLVGNIQIQEELPNFLIIISNVKLSIKKLIMMQIM